MEEFIRAIFESFPEKSTITFEGNCSDCKDALTIDIVPTLSGFGLLGGAFVECLTDRYVAKCPECYKVNAKMVEPYNTNANVLPVFDKKDLLSIILSTRKRR